MNFKRSDAPDIAIIKATIFIGAFLVFLVQPMVGRTLLPLFGGLSTVWIVCLATFQTLLLAGYFYAHLMEKRRNFKVRCWIHVGLLVLAGIWIASFVAGDALGVLVSLAQAESPVVGVLIAVLSMVGCPYVLLASNSSLVQVLAREQKRDQDHKSDVYHLYAISNAGSVVGLLCYPFLVEPFLSLNVQWYLLALLTVIYALLFFVIAPKRDAAAIDEINQISEKNGDSAISGVVVQRYSSLLWVILPGLSCFLLNSITAYLTSDLTPLPLVWVILLVIFLFSYIIGFSRVGEKGVSVFGFIMLVCVAVCGLFFSKSTGNTFLRVFGSAVGLLLAGGLFLHSWLYKLRPTDEALTKFYLCVALGGTIGGILSGFVSPFIFSSIAEYPLALVFLLLVWLFYLRQGGFLTNKSQLLYGYAGAGVCLCIIGYAMILKGQNRPLLQKRSFYGVLSVRKAQVQSRLGELIDLKTLNSGNTIHGIQFEPHYLRDQPTAYFSETGGGIGITGHPYYTNGVPMRVGVIGLGIGTLACWGRANDFYRFYEIDQNVVDIATNQSYFTFISNSSARCEIVTMDARLALEQEQELHEIKYDVLVLDAFTGDSVPYHLLTKEAFAVYFDRLKPDGILALHITNWHINLVPICKAAAQEFDKTCVGSVSQNVGSVIYGSKWVYISEEPVGLSGRKVAEIDWPKVRDIELPLDSRGSLLSLIQRTVSTPLKEKDINLDGLF